MDTNYEDKMYQQIEKSLSNNNINDKLFLPIEIISSDDPGFKTKETKNSMGAIDEITSDNAETESKLSRAEYISQAREACLRKMSSLDSTSRIYDYSIGEENTSGSSLGKKKRDKASRLFFEGADKEEEDNQEEFSAYRSLIIRTVCAVAIFACIFIIDKLKVDWGTFSYNQIREYVTGNNQLKTLEEIIISWIK